jgi:predicted permease
MVVGTGLLVRSVQKIAAADPGFNAHQNMLVAELVPAAAFRSSQECANFVRESRRRIEALPGVNGTAVSMRVPFGASGSGATRKVFLPGMTAGDASDGVRVYFDPVSDSYFEVLGTRLLRGRTINAHEMETGARVMVVNQWMANRFWPNADAVGQRVRLGKPDGDEYEIVGVVENGIYAEFDESPKPYLFTPMSSGDYGELELAVRTSGSPESAAANIRSTLHSLDPNVPVIRMRSLRDHVREAMYAQRLTSTLVATLGALGLLLAAVGLFGVMSFLVGRRTQEIGVRLALGAPRSNVFALVLGRALAMTGIGIVLGIAGAMAATRALSSLLFGVTASDSVSFIAAVIVLAVVGCGAALLPAFRATRIDPLAALHYE